jgi:hypothetical protein
MLRQCQDGTAVQRRERAQVQDARLDALAGKPFGDAQHDMHVCAVGDDREVRARPPQGRTAECHLVRRIAGEPLLDSGVAIKRDVLVEEHRIGVGDRGSEQRPRILRG